MLFDNYQRFINNKLKEISSKDQFRQLKVSKRSKNSYVINDKIKLLSFACNDYLSLSTDKRLIEAAQKATVKFGTGSGASRLITGNNPLYNKLESNLREIKKTEACIVFGSGFLANLGVISALANKNDLILIDSLSHSSSFMGAKLTKAKVIKYKHNCIIDLEKKLIKYRKKYHKCMILTEGVFSMDGDISPQEEISYLKNKYNALFILDDAHGLGVLGDGTGSNSIFKNKIKVDVYVGTLSKSVGSYGGFICGKKSLIDFLVNRCRTQIYTTGLPPAVLAASIRGISIIASSPNLVKKPLENAIYFCNIMGFNKPQSPIVPVIMKEEKNVIEACNLLRKSGFLVGGIRPPTVPQGTARLRLAFNSSHSKLKIKELAKLIKDML
tara:strand:+ start:1385 stop:2536 length:1152 start_codon:yes stop_codon:yes gene_type:complete